MSDAAQWIGAWSEFEAMRAHQPAQWDEAAVTKYNELMAELGMLSGHDLSRFLVPDLELRPKPVSARRARYGHPGSGSVTYSKTRYCVLNAMAQRLLAVATYFANFQPTPSPKVTGFQPPE